MRTSIFAFAAAALVAGPLSASLALASAADAASNLGYSAAPAGWSYQPNAPVRPEVRAEQERARYVKARHQKPVGKRRN